MGCLFGFLSISIRDTSCALVTGVQTGVVSFKLKTAYETRISDWSSDVCSSDLPARLEPGDCLAETGPFLRGIRRAVAGVAAPPVLEEAIDRPPIGRASCRERVCRYV